MLHVQPLFSIWKQLWAAPLILIHLICKLLLVSSRCLSSPRSLSALMTYRCIMCVCKMSGHLLLSCSFVPYCLHSAGLVSVRSPAGSPPTHAGLGAKTIRLMMPWRPSENPAPAVKTEGKFTCPSGGFTRSQCLVCQVFNVQVCVLIMAENKESNCLSEYTNKIVRI